MLEIILPNEDLFLQTFIFWLQVKEPEMDQDRTRIWVRTVTPLMTKGSQKEQDGVPFKNLNQVQLLTETKLWNKKKENVHLHHFGNSTSSPSMEQDDTVQVETVQL